MEQKPVPVKEGVILPAYRPRVKPLLKAVAAVTAFALTVTGLLPSGWAQGTQLRSTIETKIEAGLEEALRTGEPTRREFIAGSAKALAAAWLGLSAPAAAPAVAQPPQPLPVPNLASGAAFIRRQKITGARPIMPANIPADGLPKDFKGFDFNGFYVEYAPGARDKFLTDYGRAWIYTQALVLYDLVAQGDLKGARELADALIQLGKDEETLGFKGGYHFSYNTREDPWLDPRAPTGNNLWALSALYQYMTASGDFRHLKWVNATRARVLDQLQLVEKNLPSVRKDDIRYGLVLGMSYTETLDSSNIDTIGYRAYEGNFNKVAGDVATEHQFDAVNTFRLAYLANEAAPRGTEGKESLQPLVDRHKILLENLGRLWVKDAKDGDHFITGIHYNKQEKRWERNLSIAVDNNSWAGVILPYNEEMAWQAIQFNEKKFVIRQKIADMKDLPAATQAKIRSRQIDPNERVAGTIFFDPGFIDRFIADIVPPGDPDRVVWGRMLQPEATFGYIHFLTKFAQTTKDPQRRVKASALAQELMKGMQRLQELYGGEGLPYATLTPKLFTTLYSTTATATMRVVVQDLRSGKPSRFLMVDPPEAMRTGITVAPAQAGLEEFTVDLSAVPQPAVPMSHLLPMLSVAGLEEGLRPVAPNAPSGGDSTFTRRTFLKLGFAAAVTAVVTSWWIKTEKPAKPAVDGWLFPNKVLVSEPGPGTKAVEYEMPYGLKIPLYVTDQPPVSAQQFPARFLRRQSHPITPPAFDAATFSTLEVKDGTVSRSFAAQSTTVTPPAIFQPSEDDEVQGRIEEGFSKIWNAGVSRWWGEQKEWNAPAVGGQALAVPLWDPWVLGLVPQTQADAFYKGMAGANGRILYGTHGAVAWNGYAAREGAGAIAAEVTRHLKQMRRAGAKVSPLMGGRNWTLEAGWADGLQHIELVARSYPLFNWDQAYLDLEVWTTQEWKDAVKAGDEARLKDLAWDWYRFHQEALNRVPFSPLELHTFVQAPQSADPAQDPFTFTRVLRKVLDEKAEKWDSRLVPVPMAYAPPERLQESVKAAEDALGVAGSAAFNLQMEPKEPAATLYSQFRADPRQGEAIVNKAVTGAGTRTVVLHVGGTRAAMVLGTPGRVPPYDRWTRDAVTVENRTQMPAFFRFIVGEPQTLPVQERAWMPVPQTSGDLVTMNVESFFQGLETGPTGAASPYRILQMIRDSIHGNPKIQLDGFPLGTESMFFRVLQIMRGYFETTGSPQVVKVELVSGEKNGAHPITGNIMGSNAGLLIPPVHGPLSLRITVIGDPTLASWQGRDLSVYARLGSSYYGSGADSQMEAERRLRLPIVARGQQQIGSVDIPIPQTLRSGVLYFNFKLYNERNEVVDWVGASQDPLIVAAGWPTRVAEVMRADGLLDQQMKEAAAPDKRQMTNTELMEGGRQDLVVARGIAQQTQLGVVTAGRLPKMARVLIDEAEDLQVLERYFQDLRRSSYNVLSLRVPELEVQAYEWLKLARAGFPGSAIFLRRRQEMLQRIVNLSRLADRYGLEVVLELNADEMRRIEAREELLEQDRRREDPDRAKIPMPKTASELVGFIIEVNDRAQLGISGFHLYKPTQKQRAEAEIEIADRIDAPLIVSGPPADAAHPERVSSAKSLYAPIVELGKPETVLPQLQAMADQPAPAKTPYGHAASKAVFLEAPDLQKTANWLAPMPLLNDSDKVRAAEVKAALLERVSVPTTDTLLRAGLAPAQVDAAKQFARTADQQTLNQALKNPAHPDHVLASAVTIAWADGLAKIQDTQGMPRFGTDVETFIAGAVGRIRPMPLIYAGQGSAEVNLAVPSDQAVAEGEPVHVLASLTHHGDGEWGYYKVQITAFHHELRERFDQTVYLLLKRDRTHLHGFKMEGLPKGKVTYRVTAISSAIERVRGWLSSSLDPLQRNVSIDSGAVEIGSEQEQETEPDRRLVAEAVQQHTDRQEILALMDGLAVLGEKAPDPATAADPEWRGRLANRVAPWVTDESREKFLAAGDVNALVPVEDIQGALRTAFGKIEQGQTDRLEKAIENPDIDQVDLVSHRSERTVAHKVLVGLKDAAIIGLLAYLALAVLKSLAGGGVRWAQRWLNNVEPPAPLTPPIEPPEPPATASGLEEGPTPITREAAAHSIRHLWVTLSGGDTFGRERATRADQIDRFRQQQEAGTRLSLPTPEYAQASMTVRPGYRESRHQMAHEIWREGRAAGTNWSSRAAVQQILLSQEFFQQVHESEPAQFQRFVSSVHAAGSSASSAAEATAVPAILEAITLKLEANDAAALAEYAQEQVGRGLMTPHAGGEIGVFDFNIRLGGRLTQNRDWLARVHDLIVSIDPAADVSSLNNPRWAPVTIRLPDEVTEAVGFRVKLLWRLIGSAAFRYRNGEVDVDEEVYAVPGGSQALTPWLQRLYADSAKRLTPDREQGKWIAQDFMAEMYGPVTKQFREGIVAPPIHLDWRPWTVVERAYGGGVKQRGGGSRPHGDLIAEIWDHRKQGVGFFGILRDLFWRDIKRHVAVPTLLAIGAAHLLLGLPAAVAIGLAVFVASKPLLVWVMRLGLEKRDRPGMTPARWSPTLILENWGLWGALAVPLLLLGPAFVIPVVGWPLLTVLATLGVMALVARAISVILAQFGVRNTTGMDIFVIAAGLAAAYFLVPMLVTAALLAALQGISLISIFSQAFAAQSIWAALATLWTGLVGLGWVYWVPVLLLGGRMSALLLYYAAGAIDMAVMTPLAILTALMRYYGHEGREDLWRQTGLPRTLGGRMSMTIQLMVGEDPIDAIPVLGTRLSPKAINLHWKVIASDFFVPMVVLWQVMGYESSMGMRKLMDQMARFRNVLHPTGFGLALIFGALLAIVVFMPVYVPMTIGAFLVFLNLVVNPLLGISDADSTRASPQRVAGALLAAGLGALLMWPLALTFIQAHAGLILLGLLGVHIVPALLVWGVLSLLTPVFLATYGLAGREERAGRSITQWIEDRRNVFLNASLVQNPLGWAVGGFDRQLSRFHGLFDVLFLLRDSSGVPMTLSEPEIHLLGTWDQRGRWYQGDILVKMFQWAGYQIGMSLQHWRNLRNPSQHEEYPDMMWRLLNSRDHFLRSSGLWRLFEDPAMEKWTGMSGTPPLVAIRDLNPSDLNSAGRQDRDLRQRLDADIAPSFSGANGYFISYMQGDFPGIILPFTVNPSTAPPVAQGILSFRLDPEIWAGRFVMRGSPGGLAKGQKLAALRSWMYQDGTPALTLVRQGDQISLSLPAQTKDQYRFMAEQAMEVQQNIQTALASLRERDGSVVSTHVAALTPLEYLYGHDPDRGVTWAEQVYQRWALGGVSQMVPGGPDEADRNAPITSFAYMGVGQGTANLFNTREPGSRRSENLPFDGWTLDRFRGSLDRPAAGGLEERGGPTDDPVLFAGRMAQQMMSGLKGHPFTKIFLHISSHRAINPQTELIHTHPWTAVAEAWTSAFAAVRNPKAWGKSIREFMQQATHLNEREDLIPVLLGMSPEQLGRRLVERYIEERSANRTQLPLSVWLRSISPLHPDSDTFSQMLTDPNADLGAAWASRISDLHRSANDAAPGSAVERQAREIYDSHVQDGDLPPNAFPQHRDALMREAQLAMADTANFSQSFREGQGVRMYEARGQRHAIATGVLNGLVVGGISGLMWGGPAGLAIGVAVGFFSWALTSTARGPRFRVMTVVGFAAAITAIWLSGGLAAGLVMNWTLLSGVALSILKAVGGATLYYAVFSGKIFFPQRWASILRVGVGLAFVGLLLPAIYFNPAIGGALLFAILIGVWVTYSNDLIPALWMTGGRNWLTMGIGSGILTGALMGSVAGASWAALFPVAIVVGIVTAVFFLTLHAIGPPYSRDAQILARLKGKNVRQFDGFWDSSTWKIALGLPLMEGLQYLRLILPIQRGGVLPPEAPAVSTLEAMTVLSMRRQMAAVSAFNLMALKRAYAIMERLTKAEDTLGGYVGVTRVVDGERMGASPTGAPMPPAAGVFADPEMIFLAGELNHWNAGIRRAAEFGVGQALREARERLFRDPLLTGAASAHHGVLLGPDGRQGITILGVQRTEDSTDEFQIRLDGQTDVVTVTANRDGTVIQGPDEVRGRTLASPYTVIDHLWALRPFETMQLRWPPLEKGVPAIINNLSGWTLYRLNFDRVAGMFAPGWFENAWESGMVLEPDFHTRARQAMQEELRNDAWILASLGEGMRNNAELRPVLYQSGVFRQVNSRLSDGRTAVLPLANELVPLSGSLKTLADRLNPGDEALPKPEADRLKEIQTQLGELQSAIVQSVATPTGGAVDVSSSDTAKTAKKSVDSLLTVAQVQDSSEALSKQVKRALDLGITSPDRKQAAEQVVLLLADAEKISKKKRPPLANGVSQLKSAQTVLDGMIAVSEIDTKQMDEELSEVIKTGRMTPETQAQVEGMAKTIELLGKQISAVQNTLKATGNTKENDDRDKVFGHWASTVGRWPLLSKQVMPHMAQLEHTLAGWEGETGRVLAQLPASVQRLQADTDGTDPAMALADAVAVVQMGRSAENSPAQSGLEEPIQTDRMETLGLTVAAQRQLGGRTNQEDAFNWVPVLSVDGVQRGQLFLTADGMGGHDAGEEASATFITGIPAVLTGSTRLRQDGMDLAELLSRGTEPQLQSLVTQAFKGVATFLKEENEFQQMGTTGLMVLVSAGTAYVAWVGDTRLYLSRNQSLQLLTEDDTVGWQHLRAADPDSDNLVIAERYHALNLPNPSSPRGEETKHYLTQNLGIKRADLLNVHWKAVPLQPGDRLLFSTDGVHEAIADDKAIEIALNPPGSPEAAVESIMDLAQNGSDNRTTVVVDFAGLPAAPETGPSTGSGRTEEGSPRTEATQLPVPAPPAVRGESSAVRGELVEPPASTVETALPIWVEEFEERQLIVLPPAAAADQRYPGLDSVVGQVRSVGKISFVILPADQAAIDQLVADLAVETMPTTIHEFGIENDPWLNHFDRMAQGAGDAFKILDRNPLEGENFRVVMRQILSNVTGIELRYITDGELDAVAAALGLSSQV